jgi:hypothetical protein
MSEPELIIPKQDSITVGTTSTEAFPVVQRGFKRIAWRLTNQSTGGQQMTPGLGQEAVDGAGLPQQPNQSVGESSNDSYPCFQGRIAVICNLAGGTVARFERVVPDGS